MSARLGMVGGSARVHECIVALKIVLTNQEGEQFEAWQALVNKYEPTSKASLVGKLAEMFAHAV